MCRLIFKKVMCHGRCFADLLYNSITAVFKGKEKMARSYINFIATLTCSYFPSDLVGVGWSYFMEMILIIFFLTLWPFLENKSLHWQAHSELVSNIFPISQVFNWKPAWMALGNNKLLTALHDHFFGNIFWYS